MVQLILTLAAFSAAACTPAQAISLRSTRASDRRWHRCARIRGLPVDALDFVGHYDPAVEHAGLIGAALFGHGESLPVSACRPGSVIFIRTTSILRLPARICSGFAVTRPSMHRSTNHSTRKPCAS